MKGISDPRSLYPSGTSALRKPRLSNLRFKPKVAKVGVIKPLRGGKMISLRSLMNIK